MSSRRLEMSSVAANVEKQAEFIEGVTYMSSGGGDGWQLFTTERTISMFTHSMGTVSVEGVVNGETEEMGECQAADTFEGAEVLSVKKRQQGKRIVLVIETNRGTMILRTHIDTPPSWSIEIGDLEERGDFW